MTASRLAAGSIALIAIAALAVGCSSEEPSAGTPFPPRPATVDSSGIPPCDLLTDAQRTGLGIDAGSQGAATVNGQPSAGCTWLGDGPVDYNAQFIPVGAALATTEPGATVIVVNGFGAVRSVPAETFGGTPLCQVTVDAAAGQTIRVQALTRPGEPAIGIDEQCRRAAEAASMVMTTVVATPSRRLGGGRRRRLHREGGPRGSRHRHARVFDSERSVAGGGLVPHPAPIVTRSPIMLRERWDAGRWVVLRAGTHLTRQPCGEAETRP